ncbi:MAG: RimK family protein [Spirochaetaceae bacterium]|nr:RimK family protein [Spirochaetaceae bacterium]
MKALIVVDNPKRWPLELEGAELVSAREYLVSDKWADLRGLRVYNLCRSYAYQTLGYYVSLLAAARGHRSIPTVDTLQDLRLAPVVRMVSEQLQELIQRSLATIKANRFELSVYFGGNLAERHHALARALYQQFSVPLLRAAFEREDGEWRLVAVRPIASKEIPESHRDYVVAQAQSHFGRPVREGGKRRSYRYDLAILVKPDEEDSPSDDRAIKRFAKAARDLDMEPHLIGLEDYGSIAEYDALFIRTTTQVDHPTYRMARRAAAEGLVVIDDPVSILRCTNKVFQTELFRRHNIPHPTTFVTGEADPDKVVEAVGLPCVLKQPDSAFSLGVTRAETKEELETKLEELLEDSELVLAQGFVPSAFDWRIGILGGKPLYACRYHMAKGHWQIVTTSEKGSRRYGKVESVRLEEVPAEAIEIATKATRPIGDGLYGVDLKQIDDHFLVIEVNDNPNIDSDNEDGILGEELYVRVMQWFRERLDARGSGSPRNG